jgi:hypothetical protein
MTTSTATEIPLTVTTPDGTFHTELLADRSAILLSLDTKRAKTRVTVTLKQAPKLLGDLAADPSNCVVGVGDQRAGNKRIKNAFLFAVTGSDPLLPPDYVGIAMKPAGQNRAGTMDVMPLPVSALNMLRQRLCKWTGLEPTPAAA